MPKSKKISEEINVTELKALLRIRIMKEYAMSVNEFSKSDEAKKLGLTTSLNNYLCDGKGSTSLPALKILVKHFKIGELECITKTEIKRTVTYLIKN